jgi:hypothetical protein
VAILEASEQPNEGGGMPADIQTLDVGTIEEMEVVISSFVTQGYVLANKTLTSATMIKTKQFNIIWAIIGFFFCLLPLIVYLIVYAGEKDKVAEIRVRQGGTSGGNLDELERLKALQDRGVITAEEFASQKARLLGGRS